MGRGRKEQRTAFAVELAGWGDQKGHSALRETLFATQNQTSEMASTVASARIFAGARSCGVGIAVRKAKLGLVEQRMSKAANEEMSRARGDALKFFQSLFPGERPLSY